jgi:glutamate/tyrosine decarboxylase-like PLP-dependent enzyme
MIETDSTFRRPLELALNAALSYLQDLPTTPVAAQVDAQLLRSRLQKTLTHEGVAPDRVIEELIADVDGGLNASAGGRFFAWVIGGSLPAALAADWLTSAWDQNAAQFQSGPAAAVVEEVAGAWLKEFFGLPIEASFAIVTGCQMAHVTCLAAARHRLLVQRGWDVEEKGLYGAPAIRVITSDAHHGSLERAVKLLGMGLEHIVSVPTSNDGRLSNNGLQKALDAGDAPAIVLLQAGDVNTGVFDSFETLIPVAKRHGAWVHVDGAFGLWAAASPAHRHFTNGVNQADSWVSDGHKLLNVPFDSGFAFIRDAESHRAAMFQPVPYIGVTERVRDPFVWNPEWSRRARGFSTYAALRELGRDGISSLVERCCKHAHAIVMGIAQLEGAELLWEPTFNQGLVRFLDPRPGAAQKDHDRRTDAVIDAIVNHGEAFFGGTTWRGQRAMRVSVCNWQTNESDVERTIRAVKECLTSS